MRNIRILFWSGGDASVGLGHECATVDIAVEDYEHQESAVEAFKDALAFLWDGDRARCRIDGGFEPPQNPSVYDLLADLYQS